MQKHKKVCKTLNYIEYLLNLVSAVTGYVSFSVFASWACIPIDIMSSAVGWKICVKTAGIKKYKPIIQKQKKKHDKLNRISQIEAIEGHTIEGFNQLIY